MENKSGVWKKVHTAAQRLTSVGRPAGKVGLCLITGNLALSVSSGHLTHKGDSLYLECVCKANGFC